MNFCNVSISIITMSTFMFFSGSKDASAGRGACEVFCDGDDFSSLDQVKDWRKTLSNFYSGDDDFLFLLDGRHWRTVEHYFQACKFKKVNKDCYRSFSFEGGSHLGVQGIGVDARKAGRDVRLSPQQLEEWDERKRRVMKKALYAKFSQNEECKRVLALTGNATLTHKMGRFSPIVTEHSLMTIRKKLSQ